MNGKAKAASVIVSGTMVMAAAPGVQVALAANVAQDENVASDHAAAAEVVSAEPAVCHILLDNVEGVFSWNQGVETDNATLSRVLYEGARYLCGGQTAEGGYRSGEAIENIEVRGDVANSFVASVSEFNEKAPLTKIMGCTCKGNPADGRSSANAEVSGFMLKALVEQAQPNDDVNAITFVSADGYRVTLPYKYVMQRYSIIVSKVNGEDARDAIGCSNQLWLGSVSARAFARDIVAIELTAEDEEPDVPQTPDLNQPNIGVQAGSSQQ